MRGSVGVPSTLITLSVELEEKSGRRVGWLDSDRGIGSKTHAHNTASTPGMSISKRIAAPESVAECELSS